jgi:hypothetical protein
VAIRDRRRGGEALAVVVGLDPDTPALIKTFEVTAAESLQAEDLAVQLMGVLDRGSRTETVNLAALARAVQRLSQMHEREPA